MDKYLIVLDLDGTTLKDDKTIHPKTLEVLKKLSSLGHKVVISTGRPYYSSYNFYTELELDTLICNRNGGHIHSPNSTDYSYSATISTEIIDQIMNSPIYDYIQRFYIEDRNDLYVIKGDNMYSSKSYQFDHVYHHDAFQRVTMFTLFVDNKMVNDVMSYLNTFSNIIADAWLHNGEYTSTMIEVFSKGINKAEGIKHLSKYYQIPIERIIAIGDEVNDVEMIKYAGIGVAMKNGKDHLKEHANYITKYTNDEGGVGEYLADFFCLVYKEKNH